MNLGTTNLLGRGLIILPPLLLMACTNQPIHSARKPSVDAPPPVAALPSAAPETHTVDDAEPFGKDQPAGDALGVAMLTPAALLENSHGSPPSETIWNRLRSGFRFVSYTEHRRVRRYVAWQQAHPHLLERVTSQAAPFLHFVLQKVEERDLPTELALLPMVESGYRPTARSHSGAAGIWQFMPATGNALGLQQNWWYDGRRDIYTSTEAALDYLQALNQRFDGDWLLTLAAYNAGPHRIARAQAHNRRVGKPTDFWHLNMPRETRRYIPKLLGVVELVRAPEKYHIQLKPVPDTPYLGTVRIDSQIELGLAAKLADMKLARLHKLNPSFKRWATGPDNSHRLLLPADKVHAFKRRLAKVPADERVTWHHHRIRRGQTLSGIAKHYDTSIKLLKRTNKLSGNLIRAGHDLIVPVVDGQLSTATGQPRVHTVATGESLWGIAHTYNLSVQTLSDLNDISPDTVIQPGEELILQRGTKL